MECDNYSLDVPSIFNTSTVGEEWEGGDKLTTLLCDGYHGVVSNHGSHER